MPPEAVAAAVEHAERHASWQCPACTLINSPQATTCEACTLSRPLAPASRPTSPLTDRQSSSNAVKGGDESEEDAAPSSSTARENQAQQDKGKRPAKAGSRKVLMLSCLLDKCCQSASAFTDRFVC